MAGTNDQTQEEVEGALAEILLKLPEPVREFVTGPERDRVSLALSQKYQLHADQAGIFERAYIQMLLGVISPEQFISTLRQASVPEADVTGLTNDVNEMVFKPLRRKEQELSEKAPEPRQPAPPPAPVKEREEAPAPQPAPIPPPPIYAPPFPGAQQQTYWVPVSITAVPQPYMTTEPPPQYQAPQQPPAPPPMPAPVPEPPRVEERPAPPPPPIPAWEPPAPPPNLPTHENSFSPITKDYAADPYREPI